MKKLVAVTTTILIILIAILLVIVLLISISSTFATRTFSIFSEQLKIHSFQKHLFSNS